MKLRYLVAGLALAGGVSSAAVLLSNAMTKEAVPVALTGIGRWEPDTVAPLPFDDMVDVASIVSRSDEVPALAVPAALNIAPIQIALPALQPSFTTWSREIAAGETLDAVLADAGLSAPDRAEIALALGVEFDLRRLRPGHSLTVVTTADGRPKRVSLDVDDGVQIEAVFGDRVATRVVTPAPDVTTLAGETVIDSSIFAALEDAGIPARFAVDLAQMLGGTVDFRRDLSGGETLKVMWREARVGDAVIGEPDMTFAALDLGDAVFEIVWPEDGSGRAVIYRDGAVMRTFAQPVEGARLSSVYGQRKHPVFGNTRMHTGIDFAAARGTPVKATAPGRISFVGTRGGYGRTVEISHGSDTMTRYAHLSAVPKGLAIGDRVTAGDVIGNVGATGTATGPNLHYEVRVNGRPTDPLSDERLTEALRAKDDDGTALVQLAKARSGFKQRLANAHMTQINGRL
ncbi:Peptidase family M23 [Loktanella atrilutea]|uniref:Peptidase family M23 n=1 Tax=Loktanella atrilutea TaxID=366533 RepID=A0A1M5FEL7_LOKAT|nr:M23 family metallopeptidase [Loktanella atrilutea]SHF89898.1 Peptidase family M23 [Loktanella atrilutea]